MTLAAGRPGRPYLLWGGVGLSSGLGQGINSVGSSALAAVLLLAIAGVALRATRSTAVVAMIPGLGLLPLLVGITNLGGQGERCSSDALSSNFSELLGPWPFLVSGRERHRACGLGCHPM